MNRLVVPALAGSNRLKAGLHARRSGSWLRFPSKSWGFPLPLPSLLAIQRPQRKFFRGRVLLAQDGFQFCQNLRPLAREIFSLTGVVR